MKTSKTKKVMILETASPQLAQISDMVDAQIALEVPKKTVTCQIIPQKL